MRELDDAFRGRRVFLTGHTGFKGSWLTVWLQQLGAEVTGYGLEAEPDSMYRRLELDSMHRSIIADIRDRGSLARALTDANPEVVFHLAAQSLVLSSYEDPMFTVETNVAGTAALLDVLRVRDAPCAVIVVTSDKCYENRGWVHRYRETDRLGGHDLYSASKAAAELITASFRSSFFSSGDSIRVATVRAGNVIGGGDRAVARIVPDCIRALESSLPVAVRNPRSVRPWQHVLEPLGGYLLLAARLIQDGGDLCDAWNFGPAASDTRSVEELVEAVITSWGEGTWVAESGTQPHEQRTLTISIDKARALLGWSPRWPFQTAVERTVSWYRADSEGATPDELRTLTQRQIDAYVQRER